MTATVDPRSPRAALARFRPPAVLVYGDVVLDEYLFGRADRLSPERPVPVVAFEHRDLYPGGAGNAARNLRRLGCETRLVSIVGDDEAGAAVREGLAAAGIAADGLVEERGRATPRKLRVHAGQHALVRIDYEGPEGRTEATGRGLVEALSRLATGCDAALVSDYRKGTVTAAGVAALVEALGSRPIVVDPKGSDSERYRGACYLVPNEAELDDLLGGEWDDAGAEALRERVGREGADAAADALRERMGLEAIVLTRSEHGVRLFADDGPVELEARARQVYDVTGAGDTFAAAFTAFVAGGEPARVAAGIANAAAGVKVARVGTATVSTEEIAIELARGERPPITRLDPAAAGAVAAERRARGESVVFTNGCFDLLHAGHIKYLQASRALGDCLIVGLNADRSIRRLKGPERPILDEGERAEILAALSSVDHVVVFEEDTPIDLIRAIRPDVLTKGADYEPHEIVGADLVRSWGGRVERIDLVEGKSTTGIIGRIAGHVRE